MQRHTWRERTDDGLRFFRATHHGGRWTLQSQWSGDEEWSSHDPISTDEWRALRRVLWRKYQRGRCPWEILERIDRRLADEEVEGDSEAGQGSESEP